MSRYKSTLPILSAFLLLSGISGVLGQPLVWDATSKTNHITFGQTNVLFSFAVTNAASDEVTIRSLRTSCGCTVAKAPTMPWRLAPGDHGEIQVNLDVRGKQGTLTKTVSVDTSVGFRLLVVSAVIPPPDPRQRNQMLAKADRQAVFKNDCASCHVQPTIGKHGGELFKLACGICHEAEHRASMVPDLKTLQKPMNAEYWRIWITKGQPGTLMPAFAKSEGGPLDDAQIESLIEYLTTVYRPQVDIGNPFE